MNNKLTPSQLKIWQKLQKEVFEQTSPQLSGKTAKKNKLTEEGLFNAISSGLDDFQKYESDFQHWSGPKFKKKLYWYVKRASFYYLNSPLAYAVALHFGNLALSLEDRLAAARVGFVASLNSFDEDRGVQFSTYAWRTMSNEIIAADSQRKKANVVRQKDREIIAREDGTVESVSTSRNARKVVRKGEQVELKDVLVLEKGGSEKTYTYLFDMPKRLRKGSVIKRGQLLGTTAGVITEVASFDEINEERDGEVVVHNPLSEGRGNIDEREKQQMRNNILSNGVFQALNTLSKQEQLILTERFLGEKKVARKNVAQHLQMPESAVQVIEKSALLKLKQVIADNFDLSETFPEVLRSLEETENK